MLFHNILYYNITASRGGRSGVWLIFFIRDGSARNSKWMWLLVLIFVSVVPRAPQSSPRAPPDVPQSSPELPQKSLATAGCQACAPCYRWLSPRAPQSSPRAPLLPLAARHVLPATAGCPPELPRAPLLPLAARHVLPATAGCEAHLEELPCYRWL